MTTYNMPEEPAGPVWDKDGRRWERLDNTLWLRDGGTWATSKWYRLLHLNGPVTDTPPVKVGDKITLTEFSKLPDYSIAGTPRDVYISFKENVYTDMREEEMDLWGFGHSQVTVLRVGSGDELP